MDVLSDVGSIPTTSTTNKNPLVSARGDLFAIKSGGNRTHHFHHFHDFHYFYYEQDGRGAVIFHAIARLFHFLSKKGGMRIRHLFMAHVTNLEEPYRKEKTV